MIEKPDCGFSSKSNAHYDMVMKFHAIETIMDSARFGGATTMVALAEHLGITRQRLTRNCQKFGITSEVRRLLFLNEHGSNTA